MMWTLPKSWASEQTQQYVHMLPQCHNIDYLKSSLDMSILKEDEWYDVKNYKHKSNALLFNSRQPTTILQHL